MSEYKVLDLFCGLGGFSAAFADSDSWDVTTVDIEAEFNPDIQADVFNLRPSDFDSDFDVILASPPCTQFSLPASQYERIVDGEAKTPEAKDAVGLVYHTLGIINALSPNYWFFENPRGHLRSVIGNPTATVTYCQYGLPIQKETDLWGDHPPMQYRRCARGDNCHEWNEGRDWYVDGEKISDPAERSKVPYQLSESIRDACEQALDGNAPEQQTLASL